MIILIAGSFKPTTNMLLGKWELAYVRAADGGWSTDGEDTTYTNGFSEEKEEHGKSIIIEFKSDSSYISKDFKINPSGTISKGKYLVIGKDEMCMGRDTFLYDITADTLTLKELRMELLMKYIRYN